MRGIFICGGVLIMMGQHSRSEALFYYFRLEDQVPVVAGSFFPVRTEVGNRP
jgi:hypothetical protein